MSIVVNGFTFENYLPSFVEHPSYKPGMTLPSEWQDELEILTDLEMKEARQRVALATKLKPSIPKWQVVALDKALAWLAWHAHRAGVRGADLEPLGGALECLWDLQKLADDADDGEIDAALQAAQHAWRNVWIEAQRADAGAQGRSPHAAEVSEGDVGDCLTSYGDLEAIRRALRDGGLDRANAMERAADVNSLAPGYPPDEGR